MIKDLKEISKEFIKEINCNSYIYQYKNKLKVVYFEDDSEYYFSFCFKTLPEDEMGEAHIIEHTVLAGSQRYKSKDPFKDLERVSVATYLNALTSQDITLYPASSLIYSDFKQLFKVYSDAVFSPLLKKSSFKREKNIVKSEMSSIVNNVDFQILKTMKEEFYQTNSYKFEPGGIPSEIDNLSYKRFKDFYNKNYTLDNCTLIIAGKKNILELLNIIGERYIDKN